MKMSAFDWSMIRAYKIHPPGLLLRNVTGVFRCYACQAQIISNRFEFHTVKGGKNSLKNKRKASRSASW
jgi:hypothetical protein